jgi:hypothetical protein
MHLSVRLLCVEEPEISDTSPTRKEPGLEDQAGYSQTQPWHSRRGTQVLFCFVFVFLGGGGKSREPTGTLGHTRASLGTSQGLGDSGTKSALHAFKT